MRERETNLFIELITHYQREEETEIGCGRISTIKLNFFFFLTTYFALLLFKCHQKPHTSNPSSICQNAQSSRPTRSWIHGPSSTEKHIKKNKSNKLNYGHPLTYVSSISFCSLCHYSDRHWGVYAILITQMRDHFVILQLNDLQRKI